MCACATYAGERGCVDNEAAAPALSLVHLGHGHTRTEHDRHLCNEYIINKCSDRNWEVKLPAL